MSDRSTTADAMPPELEPLHRRLLEDSAAWSARLPSTARLHAHTKLLAGNSETTYPYGGEDLEDTAWRAAPMPASVRRQGAASVGQVRGLLAMVAAAVVVVLLAGTLYALSGRPGGIGGHVPASLTPTPAPVTGVGVPGPQARFVPSAVSAHDVDADGAPVHQDGSFYPGHLVYIVARVQGMQPGERHTLTIRWYVNGQRVTYPGVPESQTVTADGYAHFQLKLSTGAGVAKLYWDLPAGATDADAALAQTVAFTILPVPTVPPEPGITPIATPTAVGSGAPVPTPTDFGSTPPTPSGVATPTPAPTPLLP